MEMKLPNYYTKAKTITPQGSVKHHYKKHFFSYKVCEINEKIRNTLYDESLSKST
jgi:hypothetical protein